MYEKIVQSGGRGGEHWRVRDRLRKLVDEDDARLGQLLWRAVREGHAFAIENPHLVATLASVVEPPSVEELVAYLSHPAFSWNVPQTWNTPASVTELFWHDDLGALIGGCIRGEGSARQLVALLDGVPAAVREVTPYILAMSGHLGVDALPDDALERCAVTWLTSHGRTRLDLRPEGTSYEVCGVELLWPDRWWRTVVEQALRPGAGLFHVNKGLSARRMFGAASAEQALELLWRVPANAWVVPRIVVETHPHLNPQLEEHLHALASGDVSTTPIHTLEILVGTFVHYAARDNTTPPTWLDPLIGRCVAERHNKQRRREYGYTHRSCFVIEPEQLKLLGESRLEAVARHESPPWYLAAVCHAPAVLREVAQALAAQHTARPRGWVSYGVDHYLEHVLGRVAAPYIAEVVDKSKTWRPEMLDALFKWRDLSTLPALVTLLGASADTRRRVVEGLKAWGEPVIEHLGPALTARAVKARTEAANLLAALAAAPEALALAAERIDDEPSDAVRALLAPLAAEHASRQRRAAAGDGLQRPPWQEREAFDAAMRTDGGDWQAVLDQGADALDEAVHYLRELPELVAQRTFWARRLRVDYTSRRVAVVNVQHLVFAAAEHLAAAAPLGDDEEDAARAAVARWIGEPDGAEHLAAFGAGVLGPIVEWLDPTRPGHPPTEAFLVDLVDRKRGMSKFSQLMWRALGSDSHALVDQVTQALRTSDGQARRTQLEAVCEQVPAGEIPDNIAELGEQLMTRSSRELTERLGELVPRVLIGWLIARDEAGDFDAVWRSDVISALGWQHLVALTCRFAPAQQPLDDAATDQLTAAHGAWRELDGEWAARHVEAIAAIVEHQMKLTPMQANAIDYKTLGRLQSLFEQLGELLAVDVLAERVLQIESTICRRQPGREMALALLDKLVLDRDTELDADARCAIVKRVVAQRVACDDEAGRKVLYAWLAGRARDPHLPEHDLVIETLVEGLSDAKKEVREAVREALARVGVPMLAAVRRLLGSHKITVRREAALVVARVPHEDNVVAIDAALAREKKADIAETLRVARLEARPLSALDTLSDAELDAELVARADHLPPLPAFGAPARLPTVHWQGGAEISREALTWLLCQLSRETASHGVDGVGQVCARLVPADRDTLARALLAGRGTLHSAQHRWVDHALVHLASDAMLAELVEDVDQVALLDAGRGTALVEVLIRRGASVEPLVTLHHVTRHESLRRAAARALANLGEGAVAQLLVERAPRFGFDDGGRCRCAESDGGHDVFARLDARRAVVFEIDGVDEPIEVEALEAHGVDAPTRKRLVRLVRHVRQFIERERAVLELAMTMAEPWTVAEFELRYVEHPVRRTAALGVVFTTAPIEASSDDKMASSFVVRPSGELVDAESCSAILADNGVVVRVVHGVELEQAGRDHWLRTLSALDLAEHLAQLARPVFSPDHDHNSFAEVLFDVPDFESGRALRRAVYKLGFSPLSLEGLVWQATRAYGRRFTVRLEHDTYALSSLNLDEPLSINAVVIEAHGDIAVPPGLHSEVVRLLRERLPMTPATSV